MATILQSLKRALVLRRRRGKAGDSTTPPAMDRRALFPQQEQFTKREVVDPQGAFRGREWMTIYPRTAHLVQMSMSQL